MKTQKRASQSKGAPEVQIAGKKRKSTESKDGSCAKLKGQTPAKKQKSKVVEEQREGGADEPLHPFKHDPADDCETCLRAYQVSHLHCGGEGAQGSSKPESSRAYMHGRSGSGVTKTLWSAGHQPLSNQASTAPGQAQGGTVHLGPVLLRRPSEGAFEEDGVSSFSSSACALWRPALTQRTHPGSGSRMLSTRTKTSTPSSTTTTFLPSTYS